MAGLDRSGWYASRRRGARYLAPLPCCGGEVCVGEGEAQGEGCVGGWVCLGVNWRAWI